MPSIISDVPLILWIIFVGSKPLNFSCEGNLAHVVHDEFAETSSEGIPDGTRDDEKSIGEKLCGQALAIYICMLHMI